MGAKIKKLTQKENTYFGTLILYNIAAVQCNIIICFNTWNLCININSNIIYQMIHSDTVGKN